MSQKLDKEYIEGARHCIDVLGLLDVLERHALGEIKMTATQVSAALALLKKVMPDLSTSALKSNVEEKELSHEEALRELG